MSTNSTISIVTKSGTVKSVYCYWDGDINYLGKMLYQHYSSYDKVLKLVELGALSYVEKELEPKYSHSFENPEPDVTVAYHRDRGEDLRIDEFGNMEEFNDFFYDIHEEYNYLFINNQWMYSLQNTPRDWKSLEQEIINKN